jgi:DNA adenine methylase
MSDLMSMFEELDRNSEQKNKDTIIRAPFPYPGGKSRSIFYLRDYIPYSDVYVEPFGGSAAVLLSRHKSRLEVFNDRYAGVVAFYRCIRDRGKMERLCDQLRLMPTAREEFVRCKDEWCNTSDDVIRAACWYYMVNYSFASLGRNFGRAIKPKGTFAGKILKKLPDFAIIHDRFREVQIENQDWRDCIRDYDQTGAIIYCDPPYIDTYQGTYEHEMSRGDHRDFLDTIFRSKSSFYVSSYRNSFYDSYPWTAVETWDIYVSISPCAYTESNRKAGIACTDKRTSAPEALYVYIP